MRLQASKYMNIEPQRNFTGSYIKKSNCSIENCDWSYLFSSKCAWTSRAFSQNDTNYFSSFYSLQNYLDNKDPP